MLGRGKLWPMGDARMQGCRDVSTEEGGTLLGLLLFCPLISEVRQTSCCEGRVFFSQPCLPAFAIHSASVYSTSTLFRVN